MNNMFKSIADVCSLLLSVPKRAEYVTHVLLDNLVLLPSTIYNLGNLSILNKSPLLSRNAQSPFLVVNVRGLVGSGVFLQMSTNGIDYYDIASYFVMTDGTTAPTLTGGIISNGLYATSYSQYAPYWRLRTSSSFTSASLIHVTSYV